MGPEFNICKLQARSEELSEEYTGVAGFRRSYSMQLMHIARLCLSSACFQFCCLGIAPMPEVRKGQQSLGLT